jgi:K(+)-stimulated pyrophosphate-energized sodium pump
MIKIASYVRDGAMAYLKRQYKVVAVVFVVLSRDPGVHGLRLHVQHRIVPFAFLTGGFFSGLCGFYGHEDRHHGRPPHDGRRPGGLNRGLVVAFRAGAVMGLVVVGFALIDITVWFLGIVLPSGTCR